MTQRSILAGNAPTVVIRGGGTIHVEGWEHDRVQAATTDRRGLKVERRGDSIVVASGGDLDVKAPLASVVNVAAGHDIDLRGVRSVAAVTGGKDVRLECETVDGREVTVAARGNVRCYVQHLENTQVVIKDRGGQWAVRFGGAKTTLRLKAEGDATLVTSQQPDELPEVVGALETPEVNVL